MDMITLAMAKAYTDGQRLASVEPGKVYTFDGNAEETETIGDIVYAKIATKAPDLNSIKRAVYTAPNGSTIEIPSEHMTVQNVSGGGKFVLASMSGQNVKIIYDYGEGLLVYNQPGYGYISLVEFAETVHPIDPKFIPAMDFVTLNGADGKQYKVAVDASGALTATAIG